jgi:hypothetical protein
MFEGEYKGAKGRIDLDATFKKAEIKKAGDSNGKKEVVFKKRTAITIEGKFLAGHVFLRKGKTTIPSETEVGDGVNIPEAGITYLVSKDVTSPFLRLRSNRPMDGSWSSRTSVVKLPCLVSR